jgi:uncharacterized protein YerC
MTATLGDEMELNQAINEFENQDTDAILYAGPVDMRGYAKLSKLLEAKAKRKNILLYLITNGGDPNAGYRVAQAIGHHYETDNFRVAVPVQCKSAGTLICVGAKSLVMFDKAELGPLDVQIQKRDEIFERSSGLDILCGMKYLRTEALETFREYMIDINAGTGLSTKTASEIASKFVIGLFEPMYAQIDPIRLGELNAALTIAEEYGTRLSEKSKSLKTEALKKLINSYPTHGFVIDRAEARNLFNEVVAPAAYEKKIAEIAIKIGNLESLSDRVQVFDLIKLSETFDEAEKRKLASNENLNEMQTSAHPNVEATITNPKSQIPKPSKKSSSSKVPASPP